MTTSPNPEEIILKNNYLTLVVHENGAEMVSLRTESKEYIWQANSEFWGRHAPILFPIVGRLVDHEYTYQGKTYGMNQHGFARNSEFKLIDRTENSLCFELASTAKSKEIYPFDFRLQVEYTLNDKRLQTKYTVVNSSEKEDMYFSIGAHPAFNCPFESNHSRREYQLVFDKELAPETDVIEEGLRSNKTVKVFDGSGALRIHDTIFDNDALIFNPNPFSKVTFLHKPSQKAYLSVTFKNYPYLGIWSSNQDAPFVCIEPWHGITDHENHNKDLTQKEGVLKLSSKNSFNCDFTVEVL